MIPLRWELPELGLGLGLRPKHFPHILAEWPDVGWFEIISENFMDTGGRPMWVLDQVAEKYPIVMHGVGMSIGSTDALNRDYLRKLKDLAARCNARWVSDHLCWTGVHGHDGHDLYPVPYTEEALRWIVDRIRFVQEELERPVLFENPSTYVTFRCSKIPEEEFIARMAEEADCALLLDVNNVYVTCRNHGEDPMRWLDAVPYDRVVQIHLAGHSDNGTHCVDTHDDYVIDEVWQLYGEAMKRAGLRPTMVEWDDDIPEFDVVHAEVKKAERYRGGVAAGA